MRNHPLILSIALIMALGATWFYLFQSAETNKYDSELSFDLVRMLSAVHNINLLEQSTEKSSAQQRREWDRIRFILSRWEPESESDRREIVRLMKRAVIHTPGFDDTYMQQYSGRITMQDIGEADESYPLYAAAIRIMQQNSLSLSQAEKQRVAEFVDTIFNTELDAVKHATPDTLGQGQGEEMVAAYIMQNIHH